MTQQTLPAASPPPRVQLIAVYTLKTALRKGLSDYLRAPAFGLFFSAVYVLGGLVIYAALAASGRVWWIFPFAVGFPILAPFAAVGLYEVSRRLETGEPLRWGAVLGVVFRQKDRQTPAMSVVVLFIFLVWLFVAHTIFALFLGLSAMVEVSQDPAGILLSPDGMSMLAVGTLVGAVFAAVLFSITVVSLPLLLEKELDFVTAMITSVSAVIHNPQVMALWAAVIAGLLFLGMVPAFLGLFIVLPVLGHASWHVYRAALRHPGT
ncbi:MAG: DUF2189 domain-containing protein [Paracoccaceae bacterium]|nr:DUF2189 domain-containing protein [Paracoccaceae bacterium]MDE3122612.1 DUF2189 domain-containing protein [Paracoccaceae bacterium]